MIHREQKKFNEGKVKINSLWPVHIAEVQLCNVLADKVEKIIVSKLNMLSAENDKHNKFYTDFHTRDNRIDIFDLIPEFCLEVENHVKEYSKYTDIKINDDYSAEYWTQDYKEKSVHRIHDHGIHGISGTYYVRANDAAGAISFINPNQSSQYVNYISGEPARYEFVKPEKGKLVLFPSYLLHEVSQSGPNAIRTSISFNFPCSS
jgi:uncharacterized protein (TIGR02466 family)